MKFVPSVADDLLAPLPGSLTGRALSSLALRNMHELMMHAESDEPVVAYLRSLFRTGRFDGAPKLKVALFSSPGARAAFAEAFYFSGDEEALIVAAHHAAYHLALVAPEFLSGAPEVESVAELLSIEPPRLLRQGAPLNRADRSAERPIEALAMTERVHLFGIDRVYPSIEAVSEAPLLPFRDAVRLIGLSGTSELLDLARFFPVMIPSTNGTLARFGVLGFGAEIGAVTLAIELLEALAFEKLRLYLRLRNEQLGEGAEELIRYAIRENFFTRLKRMRLPSFERDEFIEARSALRMPRPDVDPEAAASIAPELRKLID